METAEFLEALYKDLQGGALSVTVKASGGMRTKWFPSGQYELPQIVRTVQKKPPYRELKLY